MENSITGLSIAQPALLAIGLKRKVMRRMGNVPLGKGAQSGFTSFSRQARQSMTAQDEVTSAWTANAVLSVTDVPRRNGVFVYDASTRAWFAARE